MNKVELCGRFFLENVIVGEMAKSSAPSSSTPSPTNPRSPKVEKLVEKLPQRPQLLEQFEAILALADSFEGSADEVESLLIAEIRRLGKTTMESWASHAEERAAQQFKADHADARQGKKKTLSWYCVFGSMVGAVEAGPRQGLRPRQWEEIRLAACRT